MNTFKILFFIILFVLVTILAGLTKPVLHKSFTVVNSEYKIENSQTQYIPENINQQPVSNAVQEVTTKQQQPQQVIIEVIEEHVKTQPVIKKTQAPIAQTVTPNNNAQLLERVVKNVQNSENQQTKVIKNVEQPKTTQIKTVTTPNKTLTEQEEIIAWNKWRSDLQNQVMKDSKISAPIGTTFNFSFVADKNGNVSNINTWSNSAAYTSTAKRVIKPVLASYQHTAILNFPPGTKRTVVVVEGSFTMANTNVYSTPGDYSDYERVRR